MNSPKVTSVTDAKRPASYACRAWKKPATMLVTAPDSRPDDLYERRNLKDLVDQTVARLSSHHREVFVLRELEGKSYEEIAERRFAGWAMGQVQMAGLNPALLLKYSARATLDPYALPGRASMALFDDLVATASIACDRG